MQRKYVVTSYAIGKLRDRLEANGRKTLLKYSGVQLGDRLDESVSTAVAAGAFRSLEDKSGVKDSFMVDISDSFGCDLWAFVRPDQTKDHKPTGKSAIVTVMDHRFVAGLEAQGKLGKITPEEAKLLAKELTQSTPDEIEPRLVTYRDSASKPFTIECIAKDLTLALQKLANEGVVSDTIRVWKPVKAKARIVIDLEEE